MIRSMTGYAATSAQTPRGMLALEMRTVNSRFLDIQFRVTEELRGAEPLLRELIGARVARGKVDCRLSLGESEGAAPRQLNAEALAQLRQLAAEAKRAFPDAAPLGLAEVLRWPGVMAQAPLDEAATRAAVEALARKALDELAATREREGARLAAVIAERVTRMRRIAAEAAPLVPEALAAWKTKLTERLREAQVAVDEDRIRAELALQAARGDVDEELSRLDAHLAEVDRVLAAGGAAGKRLDFLAQELNREANTLASKAVGLKLADCALELKLLIEQVREQVQNIE
jgi:uncharacterized protein (TIGR00255 family)